MACRHLLKLHLQLIGSMQRQYQCNACEESHLHVGMTWKLFAFAGTFFVVGSENDGCLRFCSLAWVARLSLLHDS